MNPATEPPAAPIDLAISASGTMTPTATRTQLARLRSCHQTTGDLPRLAGDVLLDMESLRARCAARSPVLRVFVLDLGDVIVVGLDGELAAATGPFLRERLRPVLRDEAVDVALDCSLLRSITPEGATVLSTAINGAQPRSGRIAIRQPAPDVLRVLASAGLDHRVEIEQVP